ncbi:MAG: universal stress protein [Halodesulfurarchaeum sp.]
MTQDEPDSVSASGAGAAADESGQRPPRYLFTVDGQHPRSVLPLVCDLAADAGADLFIGAPVTVPEQTPLEAQEPQFRGDRLAAKHALAAKTTCGEGVEEVNSLVRIGHHRDAIIADMVGSVGITTLIEEVVPESGIRSLFEGDFEERAVSDTCDTITVSRLGAVAATDAIDSILAPIAAGPHSGMAIDVAVALARQNDASVELMHVEDVAAAPEDRVGEQVLATGIQRARDAVGVSRTLLEGDSVAETIITYSADFDLTVIGAPREGLLKQFVRGTVPSAVSEGADSTVLTTYRAGVDASWLDRWL